MVTLPVLSDTLLILTRHMLHKTQGKPAPTDATRGLSPQSSFQDLILTLQQFWAARGCVILQPYDMEVGAGTFHPATTLRSLGPKPWKAAYVQPCRRPTDGRYGENPNRLQHYYQFQVILKPSPKDIQDLYLHSLAAIGIDSRLHDIRFVEDDWESPTLGAWGLGWEVWCDGMEVSQFTYFQQVGGFDCRPVSGELTYGLERLAMYVQGVDNVFDTLHYYQFQVILKPSPKDIQDLYLHSLAAIGIDSRLHDIRFVEDDWESPTLGAWGLGWEVWCDGMEVSQFTYFQQVGGFDCRPVSGELTYGLERLAMYVQGVDNVFDLNFNGREGADKVAYRDVFLQAEKEFSRYNFEIADTAMLLKHFEDAEAECKAILDAGDQVETSEHLCVLPAYDQCIKASHIFNLLDARNVISVTERQSYILRVRDLARACCAAWLKTEAGGG